MVSLVLSSAEQMKNREWFSPVFLRPPMPIRFLGKARERNMAPVFEQLVAELSCVYKEKLKLEKCP